MSQGVVDGIVAEDIGKFPDTNLAESLQRISGVSIDRSIGEGLERHGPRRRSGLQPGDAERPPDAGLEHRGDHAHRIRARSTSRISPPNRSPGSRSTRPAAPYADRRHRRDDQHQDRAAARQSRAAHQLRREGRV